MRVRNYQDSLVHHHVIPTSRGGLNDPKNIITVPQKKHEAYHLLFGNKTIPEIVEYLQTYWMKGEKK